NPPRAPVLPIARWLRGLPVIGVDVDAMDVDVVEREQRHWVRTLGAVGEPVATAGIRAEEALAAKADEVVGIYRAHILRHLIGPADEHVGGAVGARRVRTAA